MGCMNSYVNVALWQLGDVRMLLIEVLVNWGVLDLRMINGDKWHNFSSVRVSLRLTL